jgi:hypothetical protein
VGGDILERVVDVYRRRGPMDQRVAARSFLESMSREDLAVELGALLDDGSLLASTEGTVMLGPGLRASILAAPVLTNWVEAAWLAAPHARDAMLTGIRAELNDLVVHCMMPGATTAMLQRAAELSGVLAMVDLNPAAIDLVAQLDHPPRVVVEHLRVMSRGRCHTLTDLLAHLRRVLPGDIVMSVRI